MTWLTQIVTVVVLAITVVTPGEAMDCFLCSYSPRGNTSRKDHCTDDNFVKEQTEVRACDLGCESVTVLDVNGEMESYHRNCASKSISITNDCITDKSVALTRIVCSCDWPYCNSATSREPSKMVAMLAAAIILSSWLFSARILGV